MRADQRARVLILSRALRRSCPLSDAVAASFALQHEHLAFKQTIPMTLIHFKQATARLRRPSYIPTLFIARSTTGRAGALLHGRAPAGLPQASRRASLGRRSRQVTRKQKYSRPTIAHHQTRLKVPKPATPALWRPSPFALLQLQFMLSILAPEPPSSRFVRQR